MYSHNLQKIVNQPNSYKLDIPEAAILKSILYYLRVKKYVCWRQNTGSYKTGPSEHSRYIRFGYVGSGDIIGLDKNGRFFSIEVKRDGKVPTKLQEYFMNEVNASKGLAFVAYSLEDVIAQGL